MSDINLEPEFKKLKRFEHCHRKFETYNREKKLRCFFDVWSNKKFNHNENKFTNNKNEEISIFNVSFNFNIFCYTYFKTFNTQYTESVRKKQKVIKRIEKYHTIETNKHFYSYYGTIEYDGYIIYTHFIQDTKYDLPTSKEKFINMTPEINILKNYTKTDYLFNSSKNM